MLDLRPLKEEDLPLLFAWSQNEKPWLYLTSHRRGEALTWESHVKWFRSREYRLDWLITLNAEGITRPIGVIHAANLDTAEPEIGLYIGDVTAWGKGYGTAALRKALSLLKSCGITHAAAVIHPGNKRSIQLFSSFGFKLKCPMKERGGQDRYVCTID